MKEITITTKLKCSRYFNTEKNIKFLNVEEHENYHKDGLHER